MPLTLLQSASDLQWHVKRQFTPKVDPGHSIKHTATKIYTCKIYNKKQATNINYCLNHNIVVKLHDLYTQFPRNVRLSHRGITVFCRIIMTFLIIASYKYICLLTY